MKKALPLIIGIIVFCLLLGGYFALREDNRRKEEQERAQEFLYNYASGDITALSFTNAEEAELTLELLDGVWKLKGSGDTQISAAKVEELLDKVKTLTVSNTLQNVEDLEPYGLAKPSNRVAFTAAGTEVSLCIGAYNATTASQYVYLNDDTSTVYAVNAELTGVFNVDASGLTEEEGDTQAE